MAELFVQADQNAVRLCVCVCVCVCLSVCWTVWMLPRVAQIITAAHAFVVLYAQTNC